MEQLKGIIIDTTLLCNNKCSFCWRYNFPEHATRLTLKYREKLTMNFDLYRKIVDEASCYPNINWMSLCGPMGDPLLNVNLGDFTEYAFKKKHFKSICINTNGLALGNHNLGILLNSTTEISFSIDTIHKETYQKIHGVDALDAVLGNVSKLVNYKRAHGAVALIWVRFTESENNLGQYPEFEEYFLNLGVDRINYTKMHSFAGVFPQLADRATAALCNQPQKHVNFDFLGNLVPCCINWKMEPSFGNIADHSLQELWEGPAHQNWLKNRLATPPCDRCGGLGNHVQKQGLLRRAGINF